MARRHNYGTFGEYSEDAQDSHQPMARIGVRSVTCAKSAGRNQVIELDPGRFRCSRVAAQLADEWVEYVEATEITAGPASAYRRAIDRFCSMVDTELESTVAPVDLTDPRTARLLAKWERGLAATYSPGSNWPAYLATSLRTLLIRRDDHPERAVDPVLARTVRGPLLVSWGEKAEHDEFSRKDKQALVRAAWAAVNELEKRLAAGWRLVEEGRHPDAGSWLHLPDLLWGLAHGEVSPKEITSRLPSVAGWPDDLRSLVARPDGRITVNTAKQRLVCELVAHLYPTSLDLHAFRVLLMDATGRTSEEVTGFGAKDVEFLAKGVRLTFLKKRAGRIRHRAFRDGDNSLQPDEAEPVTHEIADRPRREAGAVVRRMINVTAKVRDQTREVEDTLFVRAAVLPGGRLVFDRWNFAGPSSSFVAWARSRNITVSGDLHIARLRKSTKVEKAIVARGRVSVAADDHLEETFAGHYAQGTTLRIISGDVITAAQEHWFRQAVDGPTVITAEAAETAAGTGLDGFGLEPPEAEGIISGQLDMGLSHCRDPRQSPYSPSGELCAVAPLRCLECRNAWILPTNLPQLLLFRSHLERSKQRLPPAVFTAQWGQSWANLLAVLADRTPEELDLARLHIAEGREALHLPLTAHTEFDQ
ncbi:hypothetical protein OG455_03080 [Kitasatospora sp. NBC_01287]|uniref:hypothetical protein n=1 Tax=Kitasatospora sp. NBC_01287 TaxID=2903573 RepID=UPI00225A167E|nr:hypothetical protein [Kitasatospora sp. NBC_01287]MCX4744511.1 hypothetical protein [Kitasatospora sp. NBC_01287]